MVFWSLPTDWRHWRGLQRAKKAARVGEQLQVCVGRDPRGDPGFQHFWSRWCGHLSSLAAVSAYLVTVSSCGDLQPHVGTGPTCGSETAIEPGRWHQMTCLNPQKICLSVLSRQYFVSSWHGVAAHKPPMHLEKIYVTFRNQVFLNICI